MESSADVEALSSRDISVLSASAARTATEQAAALADPLIGVVVADRYRILEPIGRGGMGVVYKVEHVRIGKLLAMKLLTGELSRSAEMVRRFKREALTVSKLASPSTVQVFDFGVSDGLTYLVMELVHGESLGRVLARGGPIPGARVAKIVIQVASSLAEAHKKGIVHRDVKPENIMLLSAFDGADIAKVLDFGLAKLRESEGHADITNHGTILGTPYYMAPEQIRGDEVDARTDVYGVGVLMYRLLTGLHPFVGKPMKVLSKHLTEAPVPPHVRTPELRISEGLSAIVMRALEKDPKDRYPTVEALREALIDELASSGSTSVESLLDTKRLRHLARIAEVAHSDARPTLPVATRDEVDAYERRLRRKRYWLVAASSLILGAVVGLVAWLAQRRPASTGLELEPNDDAAHATPLPLGEPLRGHLGERIDAEHGDRDFYSFDVGADAKGGPALVSLRVTALPNIPMCTMLYRSGFDEPIDRFCVGHPGRDLVVPALSLEPGHYLAAVVQDLSPWSGAPAFIYENVSDTYTISVTSAHATPATEIEPNDSASSANAIELGAQRTATLAWARDEDVFCVADGVEGTIRWKVRTGPRESGVLEVTLLSASGERAPIRIQDEDGVPPAAGDTRSPWQSDALDVMQARCLRLKLAPRVDEPGPPHGGAEPYVVEVDRAP